jgi:hypothetical protein
MQFRRLQHLTGIFQKSKILSALKSETGIPSIPSPPPSAKHPGHQPTAAQPVADGPVIFAPLPICFYTFIVENYYDPHRPPHPRHRVHPRAHRRIPLLPPADRRYRRAGEKRSRTLKTRMHKRDPEGFRQPLAFNAEGQDLRANYFYPKTFFPDHCINHKPIEI